MLIPCFNLVYQKDFLLLINFIFPPDENFRVHQNARHELTIEGMHRISRWKIIESDFARDAETHTYAS